MRCTKAQQLVDDLVEGRLSESLSHDVRRHLNDCTDCRVAQQRAARLQGLLAIKRHERPAPQYFDHFLDEFHHRVEIETAPRPGLWEWACARLHIRPVPVIRYGFAHALGVVVAVAMIYRGLIATDWMSPEAANEQSPFELSPTAAARALPAPHSTPQTVASLLPPLPEPTPAGSALIIPVSAGTEVSVPRYVLDRITVTPASYEVASIHF